MNGATPCASIQLDFFATAEQNQIFPSSMADQRIFNLQ